MAYAYLAYLQLEHKFPPWSYEVDGIADRDTRAASHYWVAMSHAWTHRRFFVTASGKLGLGPKVMRECDILVVLFGGPWPFVLRLCGTDHQFPGHCYVNSTMHGEAVREHYVN